MFVFDFGSRLANISICTQEKIVTMSCINPTRDLLKELAGTRDLPADHIQKLEQLKQLLEDMLIVDPARRATVSHALQHTFIREPI